MTATDRRSRPPRRAIRKSSCACLRAAPPSPTVDIPLGDGTAQRVSTEIAVRDVLVAGLGDSIAAGEGNPDKAVELDGGFCFKRFLSGGVSQYFRPSRAGYDDDRSCENGPSSPTAARDWARHGARWMNPACHRSLYSYQVRTTLASRDRAAASRRDLGPARLHRRDDRRRHVRRPARRRLPMGRRHRNAARAPRRRNLPNSETSWRRCTGRIPSAISTWCC